MHSLQDRLNSLQPYITGIRYVEGLQLVDANFKEGWVFPESKLIRKEKISDNYYMFFSEDKTVTIHTLLDYIQTIITFNIERELKYELLKIKVKELQELFKETSLSKLEYLRFTFDELTMDSNEFIPPLSEMDDMNSLDETTTPEALTEANILGVSDDFNEDEDEYEREARLHEEAAFRAQQEKLTTKLNGSKGKTKLVNNIELPPKGNSIEVEVYELPEEMKEGECDCGPNEACPKCMDKKDL